MPAIPFIGAAATIGGGLLASSSQNRAAETASDAQVQAAQLGIDEQRRQFDLVQELLAPYNEAGQSGLSGLLALSGAGGDEAYTAEIERIRTSPEFTARLEAGEASLLANASATGGLRGGNTAAALATYAPQLLADQIDTNYSRYGGLATLGQNSATQTGAAAQNFANNTSALFGQQGAATAGAALARGQNNANLIGDITGLFAGGVGGASGGIGSIVNGIVGGGF